MLFRSNIYVYIKEIVEINYNIIENYKFDGQKCIIDLIDSIVVEELDKENKNAEKDNVNCLHAYIQYIYFMNCVM